MKTRLGIAYGGGLNELAVFSRVRSTMTKSWLLLSVSTRPFPSRCTDDVLLGVGADRLPGKKFAVLPYPTRSRMPEFIGADPVSAVAALHQRSFPRGRRHGDRAYRVGVRQVGRASCACFLDQVVLARLKRSR